jgi:hypothetical protein
LPIFAVFARFQTSFVSVVHKSKDSAEKETGNVTGDDCPEIIAEVVSPEGLDLVSVEDRIQGSG